MASELLIIPDEAQRVAGRLDSLLASVTLVTPDGDSVMLKFERELAGAARLVHRAVDDYLKAGPREDLTLY